MLFFFQAEDGIRDIGVTGVQTCALPIFGARIEAALRRSLLDRLGLEARSGTLIPGSDKIETAARKGGVHLLLHAADAGRSEERRVGKECRSRWSPCHLKKNTNFADRNDM